MKPILDTVITWPVVLFMLIGSGRTIWLAIIAAKHGGTISHYGTKCEFKGTPKKKRAKL